MPKRKGRASIRAELKAAERDLAFVRAVRSIRRSDRIGGYVVGTGERWLLMASVDSGFHLDAFIALRIGDIAKLHRKDARDGWIRRFFEARGQWPPPRVANLERQAMVRA